MSGHKQHKKDGQRKEKKAHARRQAFEQPVVGSMTRQRAQDVSNLTDREIAGASWKDKVRAALNSAAGITMA
jgi:hypothetical protein